MQIPGIILCSVGLFTNANDRLVQRLQRTGAVSSGLVFLEDAVRITEAFYNLWSKVNIAQIVFQHFTATAQ
jgi:hypothetical protein